MQNQNERQEAQNAGWLAAAMAAPAMEAAAGCSWLAVLTIGGGTLAMGWWLAKYLGELPKALRALQGLWKCVLAGELLYWIEACWPEHEQRKAAPLLLLVLACWAASGKENRAKRVGCVLLWPLGLLMGAVLLSGIPEIKLQNLAPEYEMLDAHLITVFLLPLLLPKSGGRHSGRAQLSVLALGLAASAVAIGVLSMRGIAEANGRIYELSRSVRLFGTAERIESLAAAAMTLGYFATLTLVLGAGDTERSGHRHWGYGAIGSALYLGGIRLDSRIIAIGSVALWVILPALCSLKNIFQKQTKTT